MNQEKADYLYKQVADELAARIIQIQYHPTRVALDQFHLLIEHPFTGHVIEIFTAQEIEAAVTELLEKDPCG